MHTEAEIKRIHDDGGNLIGEAENQNEKLHGICKLWAANGTLVEHSHFEEGERHGPYQTWWANGKTKEKGK